MEEMGPELDELERKRAAGELKNSRPMSEYDRQKQLEELHQEYYRKNPTQPETFVGEIFEKLVKEEEAKKKA
jgi:hypothetical protein